MKITGIDGLTLDEIDAALAGGGRFVHYEYCISLPFLTLRRPTDVVLLRGGKRGVVRGLPYALLTLLLAWWAVVCGLLYVVAAMFAILGVEGGLTRLATWFAEEGVLIALVLCGWWGIPWGIVYGVGAILIDLGGGHDVTAEVRRFLEETAANQPV